MKFPTATVPARISARSAASSASRFSRITIASARCPLPRAARRKASRKLSGSAISSSRTLLLFMGAKSSARNSSGVRPALRAMWPIVQALMTVWRGTYTMVVPLESVRCLPCRTMRKPRFSSPRTASFCSRPGSLGMAQTKISSCCTERTCSSPRISAAFAAWYSAMASRIFSSASARVVPWEQQPGNWSHQTAQPSSDSTRVTVYFMRPA